MRPPDLNSVECPTCGRMIATNSGKFRKHADDSILRECPMSGKATQQSRLAADMVKTARTVLNLAEHLREEDPTWVWRYLSQLDPSELRRLALVALAAVPDGQTLEQAFDWVFDLPVKSVAS